jgi:catechol 2,3-dioxygenase-like lactoylglutathione lyase family enzyme
MFLEHVNMSVADLDHTIAFYRQLLGLAVRWRGTTPSGLEAAHIGDGRNYLALFEVGERDREEADYGKLGLNHFGFVVDDLDEAKRKLAALNVEPTMEADYEPGRRLYFLDPNGVEVELVEYGNQPN